MLRQALIRVALCFSYVAVKLISQLCKHYLRALIPINTKSITSIKREKKNAQSFRQSDLHQNFIEILRMLLYLTIQR